jgi:hypothetical protein
MLSIGLWRWYINITITILDTHSKGRNRTQPSKIKNKFQTEHSQTKAYNHLSHKAPMLAVIVSRCTSWSTLKCPSPKTNFPPPTTHTTIHQSLSSTLKTTLNCLSTAKWLPVNSRHFPKLWSIETTLSEPLSEGQTKSPNWADNSCSARWEIFRLLWTRNSFTWLKDFLEYLQFFYTNAEMLLGVGHGVL